MPYLPRYTPIEAPKGVQLAALPGTTTLLSTLVAIPVEAVQCRVQGNGQTLFAYRIDGAEGEAASDCLTADTITLSNRTELQQLVLADAGGATDVVVQFFKGTVGP